MAKKAAKKKTLSVKELQEATQKSIKEYDFMTDEEKRDFLSELRGWAEDEIEELDQLIQDKEAEEDEDEDEDELAEDEDILDN